MKLLGLREPRPQEVGLKAWEVFQAIPKAWATARQIAEKLGEPFTSFDVANVVRAKLGLYVMRREDPRTRSLRWQYQRAPP